MYQERRHYNPSRLKSELMLEELMGIDAQRAYGPVQQGFAQKVWNSSSAKRTNENSPPIYRWDQS